MAKGARGHCLLSSQPRSTRFALPSCHRMIQKGSKPKKHQKMKNHWENATCSVCLEYPHNAILLLCSSHDKGCRPYMCGTSYRFSNCLEQFKKAYTNMENAEICPNTSNLLVKNKSQIAELACPLCRGQVKGWTVVEAAREYLNKKKRSCMQDGCSSRGNYKQLRKHVKTAHPFAKPPQVDPLLEEKWKIFQDERERQDVISMIRSSMPGAMVLGDYVIENDDFHSDDELFDVEGNRPQRDGLSRNWMQFLWFLHTFGNSGNGSLVSQLGRSNGSSLASEEDEGRFSPPLSPLTSDSPMQSDADADGSDCIEESDVDVDGAPTSIRRGLVGRVRRRMLQNRRHRNRSNSRTNGGF